MNKNDFYETLAACNGWWKEQSLNGRKVFMWSFYQPTTSVPEGLYMLNYTLNGKQKVKTGKFSIDVLGEKQMIKIDDDDFEIGVNASGDEMSWQSNDIMRYFRLQVTNL